MSYLFPIIIARHENDKHSNLKIKYFQGQLQLESEDALYSDGYRYAPFRMGFDYLHKQNELGNLKKFLLLGAGLGSALLRLQKVYNLYPKTHLVEYDADILKLSKKYLLPNQKENVKFICEEAMDFINNANEQYDLIGVDLFDVLENSYLLSSAPFWKRLKALTDNNSSLIVNTIFVEKKAMQNFEQMISQDFTFACLKRAPNYIYVMQTKK